MSKKQQAVEVGDATELKLKPRQVKLTLIAGITGRVPICLWGKPGIGKSAMIEALAKELGWGFIDIRAAYFEPIDLRGIPTVVTDKETGEHYTVWCRPAFMPKEDCGPTLILADELNRAPTLVQNSFFQMIQEGQVGEHKLPDNCYVMAACNYETDGGGLNRMPSALYNRFQHIHMEVDSDDWIDWAFAGDVHGSVIGYHRDTGGVNLFQFDREAKAWPSPRSWHNLSKVVNQIKQMWEPEEVKRMSSKQRLEYDEIVQANYAGCVGLALGSAFKLFDEELINLPNPDTILADPMKAPMINKPSSLYAICAGLVQRVKPDTMNNLIIYCNRMSEEIHKEDFSVMCVRDTWKRDRSFMGCEEFSKWAAKHKKYINEFAGDMNAALNNEESVGEKMSKGIVNVA